MKEREVIVEEVMVQEGGPVNVTPLEEHHESGPAPTGTLTVIAILLLVTIAFWMLVLGIQQARA